MADIVQLFHSAAGLDAKADVLANYIVTYRKKARPGSLNISNCLFASGLSDEDKATLFEKVRCRVVAHLHFTYPLIDSTRFKTEYDRLGEFADQFKRSYLSTKKWQSAPTLFQNNVYPFLNLVSKRPIRFAETYQPITLEDKADITVAGLGSDQLISNSTQFYYNLEHEFLFSTVTSLSFDSIDKSVFYGTDLNKVPLEVLFDESKFQRQLDICTYIIPRGDADQAINILRYDGSGFDHFNQVFYSEKHKEIFGEVATVPHFHFQNNVENLIYLKKEKNDEHDTSFSNAGCNAIDCAHLREYLRGLDALSDSELKETTISYGMPFLEAKKEGIKFDINVVQMLDKLIEAAQTQHLSSQTVFFLGKLYREINSIIDYNTDDAKVLKLETNNESAVPPDKAPGEAVDTPETFTGLILALDILEKVHKQQDMTSDVKFKRDLMAIETICAKEVVDTISQTKQPVRGAESSSTEQGPRTGKKRDKADDDTSTMGSN